MKISYYLNLILLKLIITVINVKILPTKKNPQLENLKNYKILKIFNTYINIYRLFLIFCCLKSHKEIKSIFKNSTIFRLYVLIHTL